MALTKTITYKWFETSAYARITSFTVTSYKEDNVKKYQAQVIVNKYTDSTCEYDVDQTDYIVKDLTETSVVADLYAGIKPSFEDWVDA